MKNRYLLQFAGFVTPIVLNSIVSNKRGPYPVYPRIP